jgi:hypothetical protein
MRKYRTALVVILSLHGCITDVPEDTAVSGAAQNHPDWCPADCDQCVVFSYWRTCPSSICSDPGTWTSSLHEAIRRSESGDKICISNRETIGFPPHPLPFNLDHPLHLIGIGASKPIVPIYMSDYAFSFAHAGLSTLKNLDIRVRDVQATAHPSIVGDPTLFVASGSGTRVVIENTWIDAPQGVVRTFTADGASIVRTNEKHERRDAR